MHENLAAHREVSGASGGVFLADVDRLWRTSPETLDVERTGNANAAVAEAEELMRAIEVPGESLTAPTVTTDWMDVADSTGPSSASPEATT